MGLYVKLLKFLTSTMTTLSMHLSPAAAILPISRAISSPSPFLCLEILGSKLRCSSWCSWCSSWCSWWSWWSGSSPKSLALGRARLPPTNGNTLARFRPSRICSSDRYSSCWASWDLRYLFLRTANLADVGTLRLCGPPAPKAWWRLMLQNSTKRVT